MFSVISLESFISFVSLSLLLAISPGPSNAFLMAQTFAKGKQAGMKTAYGFACAGVIHTILAVGGLSVILKTSQTAYQAVLWAGAGYMLYLGFQAIKESLQPPHTSNAGSTVKQKNVFFQAMMTEVLNPKVALFFLAFIPQFADPTLSTPIWLQLTVFGLLYPILAFPIDALYVHSGNKVAGYFRTHPKAQQYIDRTAGIIFILLALRLFYEVI